MHNEHIKDEIAKFMQETTPIEDRAVKPKFQLSKLLLFITAGLMIASLAVTFMPRQKPVVVYQIQDTIAYPINQKGTEITVRTLEPGENFPNIKIGPGCSMTRRSKPKSEDSFQRI